MTRCWFTKKSTTMNPNLSIEKLMTTTLVTVKQGEPLAVIRAIFEKNEFHHLPVIDELNAPLGIISRGDFYKVLYVLSGSQDNGKRIGLVTAADIMTKYPLCLSPDDSIGLAADIFLANKFHALPIVDEGRLVGLLTSHDLMAYSFQSPVDADEKLELFEE